MAGTRLTAKDFVVKEDNEKGKTNEVLKNAPPAGYIPVTLASEGRLGFPAMVHVRDYSFSDAVQLAQMSEDDPYQVLLPVLKGMIFEDVDMGKITYPDIIEILMSIYGTWYGASLEEFPYHVDDTLEGDAYDAPENMSKASIPLANIKSIPLKKGVGTPIKISRKNGKTVLFDIPRPIHAVIAGEYINKKFAVEDNEHAELKTKVDTGRATDAEKAEWSAYDARRGSEYLRCISALEIVSVNGKNYDTLDDKLSVLDSIPLSYWGAYNGRYQKDFVYGVNPEVRFRCTVTGKMITRRFRFRLADFIPTMASESDDGFDVEYGEGV